MALYLPPEEIPTPHAVAVAVVAAAKVTGEDPLDIGDATAVVRARFPAVKALEIFYGEVPTTRLGRYVGVASNIHTKLQGAQRAAWWNDQGLAAIEAACCALEKL